MAVVVESGGSSTTGTRRRKVIMVHMILMLTYYFSWQIPAIRANRIAFTLLAHLSVLQNIPFANIGLLLISSTAFTPESSFSW